MVVLIMVVVISDMCEVIGMRGLGVVVRLNLRDGFVYLKLNTALSLRSRYMGYTRVYRSK
jgi:hypothetical protein